MTENNYTKKYIFGQGRGEVAEMKLGRHKVSYNGCGAVALYNTLTEKGKETGFPPAKRSSTVAAKRSPSVKHIAEIIAEAMITPLKFLQIRMAVSAGNTTSEEIIIEPIIFMPTTMVTAVSTARSRL